MFLFEINWVVLLKVNVNFSIILKVRRCFSKTRNLPKIEAGMRRVQV